MTTRCSDPIAERIDDLITLISTLRPGTASSEITPPYHHAVELLRAVRRLMQDWDVIRHRNH